MRVFSRRGVEKDERTLAIGKTRNHFGKDRDDERAILERGFYGRMAELFDGRALRVGRRVLKPVAKLTLACLMNYQSHNGSKSL